jgi:hypothetical protein
MKFLELQLLRVENMYKNRKAHGETTAALYYKGQMDAYKSILKEIIKRK